jgi:general nucleoside transport system ATP-binding protein
MVAGGLAVIFISHKLHEVAAIADRCVVLRHGQVVGAVRTADTTPGALAALMVGAEVARAQPVPGAAGPARLRLVGVHTPDAPGAPGLKDLDLTLHGGQITAIAGVSGNGQGALSAVIGGLTVPSGGIEIAGAPAPTPWTPAAALAAGIGRIPEDRHREGTIADMTLAENAVLETHGQTPISRAGWLDWRAATDRTAGIIARYDIRCSGPAARIRLLSGGNMQKLILGRVLDAAPDVILANQPVRGLDVGAVAFVHAALVAARDRGAGVLLISEDLDEVMQLADVIHVISQGRLSPAIPRARATIANLGLRMAGQGLSDAA